MCLLGRWKWERCGPTASKSGHRKYFSYSLVGIHFVIHVPKQIPFETTSKAELLFNIISISHWLIIGALTSMLLVFFWFWERICYIPSWQEIHYVIENHIESLVFGSPCLLLTLHMCDTTFHLASSCSFYACMHLCLWRCVCKCENIGVLMLKTDDNIRCWTLISTLFETISFFYIPVCGKLAGPKLVGNLLSPPLMS